MKRTKQQKEQNNKKNKTRNAMTSNRIKAKRANRGNYACNFIQGELPRLNEIRMYLGEQSFFLLLRRVGMKTRSERKMQTVETRNKLLQMCLSKCPGPKSSSSDSQYLEERFFTKMNPSKAVNCDASSQNFSRKQLLLFSHFMSL